MGKVRKIFKGLLIFVPLSIILFLLNASPTFVFLASIISLIPISRYIGKTAENLAIQTSPTLGALMIVSFGNAVELLIAFIALQQGLFVFVKASIVGSIIISLLLIGVSMLIGGLKYKEQKFNTDSASVSSTMLIIAIAGLAIPTLFSLLISQEHITELSISVSVLMFSIYILGLIFTFVTHKNLFDWSDELRKEKVRPSISKWKGSALLISLTILALVESQLLVESLAPTLQVSGMSEIFVGVVLIGLISNISEMVNAATFALKNRLELSMEIGTNSATQIALFVVPLLVFLGAFSTPLNLVFPLFSLVVLVFSMLIINHMIADGRCNWLEGAQLIVMYIILALAFQFI